MRVFFFTFLLFFCSFTAWTEEISLIEIAVPTDFPPFAFVEKGELKGFDIDLLNAANNKIEKNEKKYPADIVKGSAQKYTEYKKE